MNQRADDRARESKQHHADRVAGANIDAEIDRRGGDGRCRREVEPFSLPVGTPGTA
jgi:hypothetical protein